jgi:TolB-like protein
MNATSPGPHDHHHAMPHAADVSGKSQERHGTTEHAGHGEPGAHDRHEGHSVAMFRDRFWITLLLSIPTLVWSGMVQQMGGFTAPVFPGSPYVPAFFGTAVALAADTGVASIENSVAVLPFNDMSAARDHDFFCEGMSEEIINALGRVPDLRVASYTSSLRFKGKAVDTQSIGRELMVSWLLEGSVRKSGDMVRIAVQLVRASDGFSAWSGRFDRRLDDIFTVQDDIAGMIAQTLTRRVGKATGPLVTSTTSHAEAYSLFLEGRYLWNKRPGDVVWQALDRFERAIAIDPSFAPAHAALAGVYGTLGAWEVGVLPPAEGARESQGGCSASSGT